MGRPTVLVLSPNAGGHYFGALIAGICREVALNGGHVMLALTADPALSWVNPSGRLESDLPIGWAHADAAIALMGSVRESYLARVLDAGIPVVTVGEQLLAERVPCALPDNVAGIGAAVDHLVVDHGHSRIGFIGHVAVPDVAERLAAFSAAMARHGLPVPDHHVHASPGADSASGEVAARRLLATGDLPTALVIGTDATAIGVLAAFEQAGVRVPYDVSIVSYDGIEPAGSTSPPLATVHQPFLDLGVLAAQLALSELAGEVVEPGAYRVPARLLRRGSCGCGAATPGPRPPAKDVVESLVPLLLSPSVTDREALRERATAVLAAVQELAARRTAFGAEAAVESLMSLARGELSAYALRTLIRRIVTYARTVGSAGSSDALDAMIWRLEAACAVEESVAYEAGLDAQAAVDAGLLVLRTADPRELHWLGATSASYGLLAEWQGDPAEGRLRVVGERGGVMQRSGGLGPRRAGLPTAAVRGGGPARGEPGLCGPAGPLARTRVGAARGGRRDRPRRDPGDLPPLGRGARVGPGGAGAPAGPGRQREAVRGRRARLGRRVVGVGPRRGGLWISERARALLGLGPDDSLLVDDLSWVHPEDQMAVSAVIAEALSRADEPAEGEFRVLRGGEARWLQLTMLGTTEGAGVVRRLVCSVSDIHQRKALEAQLREAALYDPVTGLPNRRLFLDRLEAVLSQIRRRPARRCAVIFLDLDGFKLVNDSLGHLHGDMLLRVVAERLTGEIRSTDTAARFGGDEFAVLLVEPGEDLAQIARRIQARVSDAVTIEGQEVSVTASAGITTSDGAWRGAEALLREADTAMYHAKAVERGSLSFFDQTMHAEASDRLRLQHELRVALSQGQFVVHYQPIVPLDGTPVTHCEALVRWQHPERGLLLPGEFIPVLEPGPGIVELGSWILNEVCAQLAEWRVAGHDASVAMNLSHREFWNPGLVDGVAQALRRHQLEPGNLVLEITETVVLNDVEAARRIMSDLRELGVRLSIDDFGTGQSSLHTLRSFAVDVLKIDGAFVRGMESDPQLARLVAVILELGRALGLDVVAECVETAGQEELLRSMGCSNAQGWLYSKAIPGAEAGELLGVRIPDMAAAQRPAAGPSSQGAGVAVGG